MTRVHVALGSNSYDILIEDGLLARAGSLVAPLLHRPVTVIVTEKTVADLHLATLTQSLDSAGIRHDTIILDPGERSKSMAVLSHLCESFVSLGLERDDTIIALGGGVIGDVAGFAASVFHRGISFIQIPTTLLAQVDSSVGGKTGINLSSGKNLVGCFHQPRMVLSDVRLLKTLPKRDFLAGYAEVVKYAALGDRGFFDWLDAQLDAILTLESSILVDVIQRCCEAKGAIVAADEREKGLRALLNLGHTFAHAFEASAGYDGRVLHGEAVSVGMALAFELSVRMGYLAPEEALSLSQHLQRAGLPVKPNELNAAFKLSALLEAMQKDKKTSQGQMTFILANELGNAFICRDVTQTGLQALLRDAGIPDPAGSSAAIS